MLYGHAQYGIYGLAAIGSAARSSSDHALSGRALLEHQHLGLCILRQDQGEH